jgi:hypothetical protein
MNRAPGQFMTPDWAVERLVAVLRRSRCKIVSWSRHAGAARFCVHFRPTCRQLARDGSHAGGCHTSQHRTPHHRRRFSNARSALLPTAVVRNPPFAVRIIADILDRAWKLMDDSGRCGAIQPAFALQTSATANAIAERWRVRQDMLRRDLFPPLSQPLCFAYLTNVREQGYVNFALLPRVGRRAPPADALPGAAGGRGKDRRGPQ